MQAVQAGGNDRPQPPLNLPRLSALPACLAQPPDVLTAIYARMAAAAAAPRDCLKVLLRPFRLSKSPDC